MRPIPTPVSDRLRRSLDDAALRDRAGDTEGAWRLLEEAHVLSQPWAWPHVKVHLAMLRLGFRRRDLTEVYGQVMRVLLAAPGSLSGRYPLGNTGRARVPATAPMPVPPELAALLDEDVSA